MFNKRNYDVVDEVLAEDLVDHNPALPMEVTGTEEFKESVELIHAAFPDFEATIEEVVAEGDSSSYTHTRRRDPRSTDVPSERNEYERFWGYENGRES